MGSYHSAVQEPSPRGGCGLVFGIVTALITVLMVLAGLFLPPFSLYERLFGTQYIALVQAGDSAASADGSFRVLLPPAAASVGVSVDRTALVSFAYSSPDDLPWLTTARAAVPPYLALLSDVYRVQYSSSALTPLTYSVDEPGAAQPAVLDMYGYQQASQTWTFIPSQHSQRRIEATSPGRFDAVALFQSALLPPKLVVEYDVNQMLTGDAAALADIVAPAGLQPMLSGALTGSLAPGFDLNARYRVMPIIRDFADPRALDTETVVALLSSSQLRREHVRQLASLVAGGFDGVWLDYRGIPVEQRANFSVFMRDLGAAMHAAGLELGVIVPAAQWTENGWDTGAYDWQVLGAAADYVQVSLPIGPEHYLPNGDTSVQAMLLWAVGQVDRTKLMTGLSARSVRDIQGTQTLVGYDEGLAALGNVVVSADTVDSNGIVAPGSVIRARLDGKPALAGVDTRVNAPYVDYLDSAGQPVARIWLTTGEALRWRLDAGEGLAMAGAALDDLLTPDLSESVFRAISDYKLQIPAAVSPTDLVLRWRVEGTRGLLQELTTPLGQGLETTMNAQDGNYAVNVAVAGIGEDVEESARNGAVVAMFAATPTATPLPTATPTPIPTVTPTPPPIIATAAPIAAAPGGGGWAAVRPGAGSIQMGQFEYGGHVTSASSAATVAAMKRAGMTWMKVQMRYAPGANAAEAANYITVAQQNGFKILIGAVGNAGDLANGGDGYLSGFANWLAAVASMGPNAIEIWNEPNLDREWPNGQISGAGYTNMLRMAYSAIKSSNSSVIVISAAPGPTGAENAYPGAVMNDDRWLAEVVAAGGLGYADCVGVHYNEGIIPPSASTGDPRDGYYTRYFPLIVDTYWRITGGQKPLCITELGYLTPEGFGSLDPYFGWASNVTVAQQAAWLAEAAALASQSGKVKLMIVWNVDFSYYGADPMAGYAIIRPDGSCPACDAIAAAR